MTVALLLVSHSKALAGATVLLAGQMTGGAVTIETAAGCGENGDDLGTDPIRVMEQLEALDNPAGTLILVDLGSALLSAEMALDMVDPAIQQKVRLISAPFVEGAVAAAVSAAAGSPIDMVVAEAQRALDPKREHLGDVDLPAAAVSDSGMDADGEEASAEAVISDPHGLHARPASKLAMAAAGFAADLRVCDLDNGKGPASARSLVALSSLGATAGHRLRIVGRGADGKAAVAHLAALIAECTGEGETPPASRQPAAAMQGSGRRAVPVSPGLAVGPLVELTIAMPVIPDHHVDDPEAELFRLRDAIAQARSALRGAAVHGGAAGDILAVQAVFLQDDEMLASAETLIRQERRNAADAFARAGDAAAAVFAGLDDPVLRAREADLRDAVRRVLDLLLGGGELTLPSGPPAILLTNDLPPSVAQGLDPDRVLGVIDRRGGATSHAAILLRGLGIPAVAGAASLLKGALPSTVAFDGGNGELILDPTEAQLADYRSRKEASSRLAHCLETGAITVASGRKVELWGNVTGLRDAKAARAAGAFGIGLLRTEMMFLDRADAPDEAEQTAALKAIFDVFAGRPITVRTLDAGGDKPIPYLHMPQEQNPFLGVRGLRLSLRRPELFLTQLRAILTAGYGHDIHVMLPMVTDPSEVVAARWRLEEAHTALAAEGVPHAWPVELGVMIEVPAAAVAAEQLAQVADFFSIGTNDLTQYTLAAERGHPDLASFAQATHPAVLALVEQVAAVGNRLGRHVAVCGEAAGDPKAVQSLVAAGVSALSLSAALFPGVIAALDVSAAKE